MNSTCRKLTGREMAQGAHSRGGRKSLFLSELGKAESYRKENMLIAALQILQGNGRMPGNKRDIDL